jgi:hypothetical protein
MNRRNDYKRSGEHHRSAEPANDRQGKGSKKIVTAAKTIRAVTAIAIFGIPVVVGTATVLGYGVHKAYKWIAGRS